MTGKEISKTLFINSNYRMRLYWKYEAPKFAFYKPYKSNDGIGFPDWYNNGNFIDVGTRCSDLIRYIANHNLEDYTIISNSHTFRTVNISDIAINFDEEVVKFQ